MKKSLFDLAVEYTGHDKNNLTEFQENEIDALVKFGKRVLENAAQPSVQSDDGYCSCGGEGYVMLLTGAKICNLCKRHRR